MVNGNELTTYKNEKINLWYFRNDNVCCDLKNIV